ncbi:MAG: sensor histidine kinase [Opitutales bacterium]|nr:sensor histidine kinase [Opitutales bacterium]
MKTFCRFPATAVLWCISICLWCMCLNASEQVDPRLITTAAEVKALTYEDAATGIPVRLCGVFIGSADPPELAFVIQDETETIYVLSWTDMVGQLKLGDLVELEGETRPGSYAPEVEAKQIRVIGQRPIPAPRPVTIDYLYLGKDSSHWVTFSGVVRSAEVVQPGDTHYYESQVGSVIMEVASGNSRIPVEVKDQVDPNDYVDAELQISGICFERFDNHRHFVKPFVLIPKGVKPVIKKPSPEAPYDEPLVSFEELLTYQNQPKFGRHRIRMQGVVLDHQLGSVLWLRDGAHSLKVETRQNEQLIAGDKIDVLGFPKPGEYNPMLEDAEFRKLDDFELPVPAPVGDLSEAFQNDENLIQINAKLSSIRRFPTRTELILDWRHTPIRANLHIAEDVPIPGDWKPGSIVSVSGICVVESDSTVPLSGLWIPKTFQLLLRSTSDLSIIKSPSWWNWEHVAWLLFGFLILALLTIATIVQYSRLRFQEQERKRAIAETEFSAILNERTRLAREIHDTLSQSLGAISVQLELARMQANEMSDQLRGNLGMAHQLARNALTEARNSIWNMRSQILEECDLAEALKRNIQKLVDDSLVKSTFQVDGEVRRLSPLVENNLLRIGLEAVANSIKHANPALIGVRLQFEKNKVHLAVEDDGIGFVEGEQKNKERRSFGLVGIRERADLIGGKVTIESIPGQGTRIEVFVSA